MKYLLRSALLGTALVVSSAAIAQTAPEGSPGNPVPLCSKTIKDECMNPSQAPHQMKHRVKHSRGHAQSYHRAKHKGISHKRAVAERR